MAKTPDRKFAQVLASEYQILVLQAKVIAAQRTLDAEKRQWLSVHCAKERKLAALGERLFVAASDSGQMELWDNAVELNDDLRELLSYYE